MVKTRGGTSRTSKKDRGRQDSKFSRPIGVNEKGEPVPLHSIPPSPDQQKEALTKKPEVLLLSWKDNIVSKKQTSKPKVNSQVKHSNIDRGMGMHVRPTDDNCVINRHYGRKNKGITGLTLKLAAIIKTLTGNALSVWPTKGQLLASSLSLSILFHQHPEILKPGDGLGEDVKPLTITDKLISGKRVVDVEIK
ncbi:hypothetical protein LIER_38160 [Lithospermum erythrorhizon]|uniref:Uncharacterized protein n=1 Tax=Lithospermum erythrorhizon TaxID=34254 RepID=A0AAV3PVZ3_LITER